MLVIGFLPGLKMAFYNVTIHVSLVHPIEADCSHSTDSKNLPETEIVQEECGQGRNNDLPSGCESRGGHVLDRHCNC